jgi:hypothetical protein
MDMCDGVIVIPINEFPSSVGSVREAIKEKRLWLQSTFECFKEETAQWKRKHVATSTKKMAPTSSQQRTQIGVKELSCEALVRKDMTSLMNKLTATNKEHIISQMKASVREHIPHVYVDVVWEFMLLCPDIQPLYCDVLLQLSCIMDMRPRLHAIWDAYCMRKEWIPPFDSVATSNEQYDDFCDHVKWKKHASAKIKGFIQMSKRLLLPIECQERILDELLSVLVATYPGTVKLSEIYVDQLTSCLSMCSATLCSTEKVKKLITEWKNVATSTPPSLRFKVYDLYDLLVKRCER